jgi:hypothetical protein
VVPPARHGDLRRRAHRVAVAGNTIVRVHAPRVERGVEFRVTAVLERVRGDGPPVLPASVLTDPRLLRPTGLTAADDRRGDTWYVTVATMPMWHRLQELTSGHPAVG